MKRIHWYLAGGVLAAVAIAGIAWILLPGSAAEEPWPEGYLPPFYRIQLPDVEEVPYDQGATIQAPDQPGWKARVGHEYFGMSMLELVAAARRTGQLGMPQGSGTTQTVPAFVVAAIPWTPENKAEWRPMVLIERIARLLRSRKIVSFGNPVMLTLGQDPKPDLPAWKDPDTEHWIGIPVLAGTALPEPLVAVPFPGAQEVLIETAPFTEVDVESEFDTLIAAARQTGREPMLPLVRRWSGWNLHEPAIQVQRMVPLKPVPAPQ